LVRMENIIARPARLHAASPAASCRSIDPSAWIKSDGDEGHMRRAILPCARRNTSRTGPGLLLPEVAAGMGRDVAGDGRGSRQKATARGNRTDTSRAPPPPPVGEEGW
jgi:hypothetical protein